MCVCAFDILNEVVFAIRPMLPNGICIVYTAHGAHRMVYNQMKRLPVPSRRLLVCTTREPKHLLQTVRIANRQCRLSSAFRSIGIYVYALTRRLFIYLHNLTHTTTVVLTPSKDSRWRHRTPCPRARPCAMRFLFNHRPFCRDGQRELNKFTSVSAGLNGISIECVLQRSDDWIKWLPCELLHQGFILRWFDVCTVCRPSAIWSTRLQCARLFFDFN